MMNILDILVLGGPNYWSIVHKVIVIKLDINSFEQLPTNKIDGFYDRLIKAVPSLYEHHCSEGKSGGFLLRVKEGTWMGHVVEHIALELQSLAGMECRFGKTRSNGQPGVYNVVFEYREQQAGVYAGYAAVRIAEALAGGKDYNVADDVKKLKRIYADEKYGPSTLSIVTAAEKRGIPTMRLNKGSLVQLGYGSAQKRIEATTTDHTSFMAVDLASDKHRTKALLSEAAIPVPEGVVVSDRDKMEEAVRLMGFPLAIKPLDSNHGKGVSLNISSITDAREAYEKAGSFSKNVIIERYYSGHDYRLLVVNYKLVAAAKRTPARVTGDGSSTLAQLIEKENQSSHRGDDHENYLTRIKPDAHTDELLKSRNLTYDSVPAKGEIVFLKQTANLSTGGTSEDVTDILHPRVVDLAERVARLIGLDICGVDVVAKDISKPVNKEEFAVIEVNAAPGFRMHINPVKGKPRRVGEAVVEMLFPGQGNGLIPIVAITGTNGKTTTARILAHIAAAAGYTTGLTTTDGIYVDGRIIEEGDCTGPVSSRKVLQDRSVNFAVLELARGGILRSGLAFDQCDVGIVTNVAEDHLGLKSINTLEEMAGVKSVIPETVKPGGVAVLNADNDHTYAMRMNVKCSVALFSTNMESSRIIEHYNQGGLASVYHEGDILLLINKKVVKLENVKNIPAAFEGKATFMVENIMSAALGALAAGIPVPHIRQALRTFMPTFDNMPGRMNLISFNNFTFLLDYAHNFHSIMAMGKFLGTYSSACKVGIVSAAGDRRNRDIINVGKASAKIFDKIIIRVDADTRGRKEDEIVDLIYKGISHVNGNLPVQVIKKETDAIEHTIKNAEKGALIVLFCEDLKKTFHLIDRYKKQEEEQLRKIIIS